MRARRHAAALLALPLIAAGPAAWAACSPQVPYEQQLITLEGCERGTPGCTSAFELLARYSGEDDGVPDAEKTAFSVAIQGNPWRLYDGDLRIFTVEELATVIRTHPEFPGKKKVELRASWTGVRPNDAPQSVAERLSVALGGFPVEGSTGHLWIGPKDSQRTTRQSHTGVVVPYFVQEGKEVMASAAIKIAGPMVDALIEQNPAYAYRRLGASADIFDICPDAALEAYEKAAAHGDAIGAYNAAIMRLDRDSSGDRDAAIALLKKAAAGGDAKSADRLKDLTAP